MIYYTLKQSLLEGLISRWATGGELLCINVMQCLTKLYANMKLYGQIKCLLVRQGKHTNYSYVAVFITPNRVFLAEKQLSGSLSSSSGNTADTHFSSTLGYVIFWRKTTLCVTYCLSRMPLLRRWQ